MAADFGRHLNRVGGNIRDLHRDLALQTVGRTILAEQVSSRVLATSSDEPEIMDSEHKSGAPPLLEAVIDKIRDRIVMAS